MIDVFLDTFLEKKKSKAAPPRRMDWNSQCPSTSGWQKFGYGALMVCVAAVNLARGGGRKNDRYGQLRL